MNGAAVNAARSANSYASGALAQGSTTYEKNVALALGQIAAALEALGHQQSSQ